MRIVAMATLALVALTLAAGCGDDAAAQKEKAISSAREVYAEAERAGTDFSDGPCIANPLEDQEDWVVDIVHQPRSDVDDDPANQCSAYRDGEASHFVELDEFGHLVRAE
jgi:hypothetical protein